MQSRFLVPGVAAAFTALTLARAAAGLPTALGAPAPRLRAAADRAALAGSTHAADGLFHNTLPDQVVQRGALLAVLRALLTRGPLGRPTGPVPLTSDPAPQAAATLAVTWYGHSSRSTAAACSSTRCGASGSRPPRRSDHAGCTPCPCRCRPCRRSTLS
jgi:hypothetical protein